jgi:hypothetical protein
MSEPTWEAYHDDKTGDDGSAIEIEVNVPKLDHRGRVRYGVPVDHFWIQVMPVGDHWEFAAFLYNGETDEDRFQENGSAATQEDAQQAALAWVQAQEQAWQDEVDDIQRYGREP